MDRKSLVTLGIVSLMVFPALTACGDKAKEPLQDSKINERYKAYVEVYDNADGYSNVSSFCDVHGNRLFVPFHSNDAYTAIAVIAKDPTCAQEPQQPRRYR